MLSTGRITVFTRLDNRLNGSEILFRMGVVTHLHVKSLVATVDLSGWINNFESFFLFQKKKEKFSVDREVLSSSISTFSSS